MNGPERDGPSGDAAGAAPRADVAPAVVRWRGGAIAAAALALAGCVNPFSPEGTDVGVYKGAPDPLHEQPADERNEALRERFELIQRR